MVAVIVTGNFYFTALISLIKPAVFNFVGFSFTVLEKSLMAGNGIKEKKC